MIYYDSYDIYDSVSKIYHGSDQPFSLCVVSEGQYAVPDGLVFSMPCVAHNGVVTAQENWEHKADFAQSCIQRTIDELVQERDAVC